MARYRNGSTRAYRNNRAQCIAEETHCWICGRIIDKTLTYPHPRSPSADHLVPKADGGTDDRSNLAASHLGCNIGRGAPGHNRKAGAHVARQW